MTPRFSPFISASACLLLLVGFSLLRGQSLITEEWAVHASTGSMTVTKLLPTNIDEGVYTIFHPVDDLRTNLSCQRITSDGRVLWTYLFDDPNFTGNTLVDAAVDQQGNLILAFNSLFPLPYDGPERYYNGVVVHMVKLDRQGALLWQRMYRETEDHFARAFRLYVDEQNRIYLTGTAANAEPYWVGEHTFLISLDEDGDIRWERYLALGGGMHISENNGVLQLLKFGGVRNVYLEQVNKMTGESVSPPSLFASNVNADLYQGSSFSDYYFLGNSSYSVSKYSNTGELVWEYAPAGTGMSRPNQVYQIVIDVAGHIYAYGVYNRDIQITKLSPTGRLLWQTIYEGEFTCANCPWREQQPILLVNNTLWLTGATHDGLGMRLLELDSSNGTILQEIPYIVPDATSYQFPKSLLQIGNAIYYSALTSQLNRDDFYTTIKYTFTPSSTEEQFPTALVNVYPNPTADLIQLSTDKAVRQLSIFYQQGKYLLAWSKSELIQSNQIVSLSSLPSGVYSLHVYFEDGSSTLRRVMRR